MKRGELSKGAQQSDESLWLCQGRMQPQLQPQLEALAVSSLTPAVAEVDKCWLWDLASMPGCSLLC